MTLPSTTGPVVIADLLDHPKAVDAVTHWIDGEWSSFSGRTLEQTRARFSKGIERDRLPITQVALVDNKPVGVASLRARDSFDFLPGATPWICNVFVDETARGRQVASSLCNSLQDKARSLGYDEVFLATPMLKNSLYHRLDFREVARVDAHDALNAVLRKSLDTNNDQKADDND